MTTERTLPPAGWYDDPNMVNTRRYWDGQGWTQHRQEKPGRAATAQVVTSQRREQDRPSTAYAWAVALLPLALAVLAYVAPELNATDSIVGPVTVGYWVVALVLCALDSKQLRQRGIEVSAGWAFLIPVYLIQRTRQASSTPGIPITWFASFAVSLLALYLAPAVYDFDAATIEDDISSQLADRTGLKNIDVTCPEAAGVKADDTIDCDVTAGKSDGATVTVTFTKDGSYTWQSYPN